MTSVACEACGHRFTLGTDGTIDGHHPAVSDAMGSVFDVPHGRGCTYPVFVDVRPR